MQPILITKTIHEIQDSISLKGVLPLQIPRFLDRRSLKIFAPFARNLIEERSEFSNERAWPLLANYRRDRSMAYFVASVRTRNLLSKYFSNDFDPGKLLIARLAQKLGMRVRKAACPSFGPLFTGSFSRQNEFSHWIRSLDRNQLQGWEPYQASRIWRLVVPVYTEEDCGTIATYPRCKSPIQSMESLVDQEVVHMQLRNGDALIFDAFKPMEKLAGRGRALLLEAYVGRLDQTAEWVIWS
jgi:hypothetical protein